MNMQIHGKSDFLLQQLKITPKMNSALQQKRSFATPQRLAQQQIAAVFL